MLKVILEESKDGVLVGISADCVEAYQTVLKVLKRDIAIEPRFGCMK